MIRDLVETFVRPYRWRLAAVVLVALVAIACALAQPLATQALLSGMEARDPIGATVVLLVAVTVGEAAALGVQTALLQRAGAHAVLDIRTSLAGRVLRWPLSRYAASSRGELVTLLTTDAGAIHTLIAGGIFELATAAVLVVGASVLMMVLSPTLFLVSASAILVASVVVSVASRSVREMSRQVHDSTGRAGSQLSSSLHAVRTIRTAGATQRRLETVVEPARDARDAGIALGNRLAVVAPLSQMATQAAFLAVLAVGGLQVSTGTLALPELLAFLMYVVLLLSPVESGLRAIPVLQRARASWDRIQEALAVPVEPAASPDEGTATHRQVQAGGASRAAAITFEDVTFHYPDGSAGVTGVSFSVEHGSRCALVGTSGAGKSTVLDLITRLQEPDAGVIRLGAADLGSLPRAEISGLVAYMEQSAPLVSASLEENLRLAAPHAPRETLLGALEAVGLSHVAERSAAGLGVLLGEGGIELSGGEAQRLALARAVLSTAPILLIDEPTSRLDAETEALAHDLIRSLAGRRTVVLVSHRLRSVRDADQIVFLRDDGAVLTGRHDELLRQCDDYARLSELSLAG